MRCSNTVLNGETGKAGGWRGKEGWQGACTDKKVKKIFLMYKELQSGAVAKSYIRKGFLIYEELRKYFPPYKEAVSHT